MTQIDPKAPPFYLSRAQLSRLLVDAIALAELVMSITEHAARLTPVATTEEA